MTKEEKTFFEKNWIALVSIVVMLVIIATMCWILASDTLTAKEGALATFILTTVSMFASYLGTKIYAEIGYNQTLRDHAVQIAGGIMVLQAQMQKLTEWVVQKRADICQSEAETQKFDPVLEHIELSIQSFRDMTDTALRGIGGVIGDALSQYERVMDEISKKRLDAFEKTTAIEAQIAHAGSHAEILALQRKLDDIAAQTEKSISQLARTSALPITTPPAKRGFTDKCPYCSGVNVLEMLDRVGETKKFICQHCGKGFNAHVASNGGVVTRALPLFSHTGALPDQNLTSSQVEVRAFLQEAKAWIAPSDFEAVLGVVIAADKKLKTENGNRTPLALQENIFGERNPAISNGKVRLFLKNAFFGRAFKFNVAPRFQAPYVNDLTESGLLQGYLSSVMTKLSNKFPLKEENSPELTKLLFSSRFEEREPLVKKAIKETLARRLNGQNVEQGGGVQS